MEGYITRRDDFVRGTDHGGNDCELDLLFHVHSDISSLLHQVLALLLNPCCVCLIQQLVWYWLRNHVVSLFHVLCQSVLMSYDD